MSIQPLPPHVVAQIKASTVITSLNEAISELLQNSLDAESTKVNISVDYVRGGCVAEDNGLGILPSEFMQGGCLGKLHHSSKLSAHGPVHGGRGTFLASVSAMSLLTITSHHHLHRSHNTVGLHKSEITSRHVPAPAQHYLPYFSHGTRVTIRDLFGSMPVRVKQRALTAEKQGGYCKDWELLKRSVVMLLLAWPRKVAVTVHEVGTGQKFAIRSQPNTSSGQLDVSNVCNILSQASFITRAEMLSWVSVRASTSKLKINGTICLEPSATKSIQFISFGIHPLAVDGPGIIHDEINRLFSNSTFGNEEALGVDTPENAKGTQNSRYRDGYTRKELKVKRKAIDRWPMFYINIQQASNSEEQDIGGILDDNGNSLRALIELLEAMILGFLGQHHFQFNADGASPQDPQGASNIIDSPLSQHTGLETHILQSHFTKNKGIGNFSSKDILGTSVKLPSFRRTEPRSYSSFEAWPRVKSGGVPSKISMDSDATGSISCQALDLERPSTAPPFSTIQCRPISPRPSTPNLMQAAPRMQVIPLLSSAGRIIRPPFEDMSAQEVLSQHSVEAGLPNSDDPVAWVNPVTKVMSLVNKRSGLARSRSANFCLENDSQLSSRSKIKSHVPLKTEPRPWLASVLKGWDNPVFRPAEAPLPRVTLGSPDGRRSMRATPENHYCHGSHLDVDRAFNESLMVTGGRISKLALRNAQVISQVDKKFILLRLPPSEDSEEENDGWHGAMLVIIDQHAADERIRIEGLLEELCMPLPSNISAETSVQCTVLENPLSYTISAKEIQLLGTHKLHFTNWGILFDLPTDHARKEREGHHAQRLIVRGLPPGIVERCKASPQLVLDLLRTEVWRIHDQGVRPLTITTPNADAEARHSWVTKIHNCPQGIIDMLNSRACRSAIMFNDELSNDQCTTLISQLARCAFPFQCAHGRPSLVPLVDLGNLSGATGDVNI